MNKDTNGHLTLIYVLITLLFVSGFVTRTIITEQGQQIKQLESALQIYQGK